jgi:ABC-type transporter Mla subunit MlaD
MNKLAAALILLMLSGDVLTAHAQPATQTVDQVPPTADQLRASVPGIKKAILAATGYDDDTVELVATDMDFVVTLLDSKLASGSNTARENEASKIASVIANAISGKEEFKGILAIHVDYVTREAEGGRTRTMNKIDVRRDSQGRFLHHAS